MEATVEAALTITDVLRAIRETQPGVSSSQLKYAINEYDIQPRHRIGIIRLWSPEDLPRIKSALNRIAGRRGGLWNV
ncbi:MAG: hypothetical protein NTU53_17640 [Planctomycetota bacterium]|nr:hypothetical protein [Planctomycetota bacterium]